jgi:hypothetical protein
LIFRGSRLETFGFQIRISENFGQFQMLKIDKQLEVHEINSQMPELQIQLNQQQRLLINFNQCSKNSKDLFVKLKQKILKVVNKPKWNTTYKTAHGWRKYMGILLINVNSFISNLIEEYFLFEWIGNKCGNTTKIKSKDLTLAKGNVLMIINGHESKLIINNEKKYSKVSLLHGENKVMFYITIHNKFLWNNFVMQCLQKSKIKQNIIKHIENIWLK